MIKKIIIIFSLLFATYCSFGQRFPLPVLSGDSLKIFSSYSPKMMHVVNDTLWILKNSQFRNAIVKAKKLELSELQNKELKKKVVILKDISKEKDSLISIMIKDRDYYKKDWKECEKDLKKTLKRNKRKTIYTRLLAVGIPVAFVAGFFAGK